MKQAGNALIVAGLSALTETAHGNSKAAGWYNDPKTGRPVRRNVGEMIALIHSEISEGLEAVRKGLPDDHLPHRTGIEVELADAVIRIADLAGYMGLDLGGAVVEKMEYNKNRADHKIENRKNNGKQF